MRKFESFLQRKLEDRKNIIFIDLAHVEKRRGLIEISVGLKQYAGSFIGTVWETAQTDVEDDFKIIEFKATFERFDLSCCAFLGEKNPPEL